MPRQKDPALSQSRLRLIPLLMVVLLAGSALAAGPAAPPAAPAAAPAASPAAAASASPAPAALAAATQASPGQFKVWLQAPRVMAPRYTGKAAAVSALNAGAGRPLALAAGDFDQDGVQDLVVGYATSGGGALAFYRGNLDAFAPQSRASFDAIGRGQFPDPFLPNARVMDVPGAPDFLATGDFNGDGYLDLAVGSRANGNLLLFFGNGHGLFTQPLALALPGPITALAAARLLPGSASSQILVGTAGQKPALLVFHGTRLLMTFPMPGTVTSLAFGNLYRDLAPDTAFVAGGQVMILRGRDLRAAAAGNFDFQLENVGLSLSAVSVDVGSFLFDRGLRQQMAVMSSDGSVHLVARAALDPTPWTAEEMRAHRLASLRRQPILAPAVDYGEGWMIAETFPAVAVGGAAPPILMHTRVSWQGQDDIAVLDSRAGQMHLLAHAGGAGTGGVAAALAAPLRGDVNLSSSAAPVAALRLRVNVDGRPGMVVLNDGQVAPSVIMPTPDPTFFVNRTDDPAPTSPIANACNNVSFADVSSSCSLREAILKANGDTIMLQAGTTYTLSRAKVAGDYSGQNGALYVNTPVTIVGGNQSTTIIQAGTNATNGVDLVMAVNEDITSFTDATASISNLTMKFGFNRGNTTDLDGWGGAMEFDTGLSGNNTLTLTNVTLTNNTLTEGEGGGIAIFNTNAGTGQATITGSIIQNNTAGSGVVGNAGGVFVGIPASVVMSSSQVLNNSTATPASVGGGFEIVGNAGATGQQQNQIHASTISGNSADGDGGGIWNTADLLLDSSSVLSGNTAGGNGGGLFHNSLNPDAATLSKVTITGNTATGDGGGVFTGNSSGGTTLTMHFSRLAGNSAAGGSNLANLDGSTTVTNDWWGTNTPATTIKNTTTTATFDPFIVLTHTASPGTIKINQSTTLTGDMSKDNHGSGAALAGNLDVIIGLPITFDNPVDGTIPNAQPETLSAGAQATATFNAGGNPGGGAADATVDQATVTASIVVLAPPSITKSFNPTQVPTNTASTITFSITNPNVIAIDNGFTDTLPVNLVVATTPNVVNNCGGSVTAVAGGGTISFANATFPANTTCTVTVDVQSAVDNTYNNSVTIVSAAAGTGNTSSASLTVLNPPSIVKAFGAATIPLNGTTSLTFTVSNSNVNTTLNAIAFTDSLPAGLVVATPSGLSSTCTGTATATAGSSSVSLSGASLAPGASCTVSANVQGTTAGVKNNSVTVSDTTAGTGNTSNASVTVVAPPTISKAFGAASVPLNGSTSLSFTITNPNATVALSGVAFSDTLPAGLIISTPNGLSGSCGAGTITATQGTNTISLAGGTIAAAGSCSFSVNVDGTSAGTQNNTTGAVTSAEGGTGTTSNTASLDVVAPPSIAKVFNPSTIALNATTSLTFTITNPAANAVALTGVAFSDTLPTGLTVANASATVCGGTLTTTAPTGIALSGAGIAVNSQCQFSVTVTGATSGQYTNTTGNVTSTNGGTGNTASANLTVAEPPSITKVFGAAQIPLNGTTSLTFTIQNPNTNVSLTGVAFTDNLPAGLVVATPNNLNNTCGGAATATAGSGSVSLSAGTLASSASCTLSVDVQGTTAGVKNNAVQVTSTEGGTGNTSNASITVIGPPLISKVFGALSIPLSGSTSLQFTIENLNTTQSLSGIGFSDTLPAGLIISTPNGLTGSCGGGTITATQNTNVISLSGATLAASSSCVFTVNVTGIAAGTQTNTTGNVTSTEGGTGGTASASVDVVAPPVIAKAFNPIGIQPNGISALIITVTNPAVNAVAETGVTFTDNLPANVVVATPNGLTNTCGGTPTATAGSGTVSLTGGTIAVSSSCTVTVNVISPFTGSYLNSTGAVSSTNGGTGNSASATLVVAFPPTISKVFVPDTIPQNSTSLLSFTITNPNSNSTPPSSDVPLTGISFTDTLPAGLVIATPNNLSNDCGGVVTATPGSNTITLVGGSLDPAVPLGPGRSAARPARFQAAAAGSCFISVSVAPNSTGVFNNTSGPVSANESGAGAPSNTATLTVTAPVVAPTVSKAFGVGSMTLLQTTTLTFTITNPNASTPLVNIALTDTLPSGLVVASPNNLTGTCITVDGATVNAPPGGNQVDLVTLTLPAAGSCSYSVDVGATSLGTKNNVTGAITATFDDGTGTFVGLTGGTASASLTVTAAPPTIAKSFGLSNIPVTTSTTLSFTIQNPNPAPLTGVAFTDTLPAGLVVATPNGLTGSCGSGTITAVAGSGTVSLAGGTLASNGSCTFSVNVTATTTGTFNNTTGAITSTESGAGTTSNTATLTASDFTIGATPPSVTVTAGNAAMYTVTITPNPAPFGQTVTLSVTGLPLNTTATQIPNPLTGPLNAATNSTLTIFTAPRTASLTQPARPFGTRSRTELAMALSLGSFGVLGIVLVGVGGERRRKRLAWVLLGFVLLGLLLAGCGGTITPGPHGGNGTPPGTYTITITGTASGTTGTLSHSTTVTLVVN